MAAAMVVTATMAAMVVAAVCAGAIDQNAVQVGFYGFICMGMAGMLLFQIVINVGMCLGIMPVIGLTLPFISYGGSSIVTMFMAMAVMFFVMVMST